MYQELTDKDVEQASGVLQQRFAIIHRPTLVWDPKLLGKIMTACIILHNMIVEDEHFTYRLYYDTSQYDQVGDFDTSATTLLIEMNTFIDNRARLRNRGTHDQLKVDLVEHIWQNFQAPNDDEN